MNHRLIAILIIAISITFLFFIGFGLLSETGQAPSPIPLNDVMSLYETALNNISKKDQITISVTTETNTTLLSNSFGDSSTKMITYQNLHTDFPTVQINEQRISGSQEISIHEVYSNGTAYQTINSAKFKYNLAAEHYLDRQIPPVLLDPSLYTNISGYKIANQYQINFEDGLQAENWFFTPNAEFVNANGNVTIDSDGNLNSSTYTLTYRNSGAMISVHYVVEIIGETDTIIVMPDPTQSYIEIPSADSIINLEHAANFLIQSEAISSKYTDDIYFEAFGDRRKQSITINAVMDDSWDVNVETITTLTNDSRIEQISEHSKVETFSNNQYTSSTDGGSLIANDQIDKVSMQNYLNNLLISTIMLPEYVAQISVEEAENNLRFNYTGTDGFAVFLQQNACEILYQNPTLLGENTQITTMAFDCFLDIDKNTGLPVASGIHYIGQYTTNGLPAKLQYTAQQSYTFS